MNLPFWLTDLGHIWTEPLYLVGGLVRNSLLGIDDGDIDIASALTPQEATALIAAYPQYSVIPKKPELGTIEIHLHQDGQTYIAEHTTFRREVYFANGSHAPKSIAFSKDLAEDAFRRDFTVNALYINVLTEEFTDPTGGLKDMEKRQLRATSPDPEIILQDDALRILRLVRFSAVLNFSIQPATFAAAQKFASNLSDISVERRREEGQRLLLCDTPPYEKLQKTDALKTGLEMLHSIGAWNYILPERAYKQENIHHCCTLPPDPLLRIAALCADAPTAQQALGADGLRQPQLLKEIRELFALGALQTSSPEELLPALALANPRRAEQAALYYGGKMAEALAFLEKNNAPRSLSALALSGNDIMRLTGWQGKAVGQCQRKLFAYAVLHPDRNTRDDLTAFLQLPC